MIILLYGALGRQFGKVHRYEVRSAAEAVRAMCVTLPGFRQAIRAGVWRIRHGGCEDVAPEVLHFPAGQTKTLRFIPHIEGAGPFGRILGGAALLGLSFMIPGSTPFIELALETGISVMTMASVVSSIGFSLALGGVSELLFKPPKATSSEAAVNMPSYVFNGAFNTSTQGNPVPVCYGGPLIVGSQVLSAGLYAGQLA